MRTAELIRFRCGYCHMEHRVSGSAAGRSGKCSSCGKRMRVPAPAAPPARPPAICDAAVFAHRRGSDDAAQACLLVVEARGLRVLEWRQSDVAGDLPAEPVDLVARLAPVATRDVRVPFRGLVRVERLFLGGLMIHQAQGEPLEVELGDEVADRALAHLEAVLSGFEATRQPVPLFEALFLPVVLLGATVVVGASLYGLAAALAGHEVHGRGRVALAGALLESIGPRAIAVVAALIVVAAAVTIARRIVDRPMMPVLARA